MSLVLFDDLGALLGDADDRITCFALGLLFQELKHFLQALDMAFGLTVVFVERRSKVLAPSDLGHLRQRCENLLFSKVDVLERVVEKVA